MRGNRVQRPRDSVCNNRIIPAMNFSQHLKDTRTRLGMSQDRAAKALGISMRMLCYYESGRYVPPDASAVITREGLLSKLRMMESMEKPVRKQRNILNGGGKGTIGRPTARA